MADSLCFRKDCEIGNRSCIPCRGRCVVERLSGGSLLSAQPTYPIAWGATRYFDREALADALTVEFQLLVVVEELPSTLSDFDRFCERVVTETKLRALSNKYLYVGH